VLVAAFLHRGAGDGVREPLRGRQVAWLALLLSTAPLAENLLMMQHATQFSFDRFKFVVPASILLAIGFARASARGRTVLASVLAVSCVHGVLSYERDLESFSRWRSMDSDNRTLARIVGDLDGGCSVLSSNIVVRGYANLLFGRGIWEEKTVPETAALIEETGACQGLFIEGTSPFPDLPRYSRVTRVRRDGSAEVVFTTRN
jgi:hypothetical protein